MTVVTTRFGEFHVSSLKKLLAFLRSYRNWVDLGAPPDTDEDNPRRYSRRHGLCDSVSQMYSASTDEVRSVMKAIWRSQERSTGYPFGEDFDTRKTTATMHLCPKRMAWVRDTITMLKNTPGVS